MRGTKFGEHHTADDWKMVQEMQEIVQAEPETNLIEVPAREEPIDLTEYITGDITYAQRINTWAYSMDGSRENRIKLCRAIVNKLHGQKVEIVTDDEKEYRYIGRCNVGVTHYAAYSSITVKAQCDPYKYKTPRRIKVNAIGGIELNLLCGRKKTVPTFILINETKIKFKDKEIKLSAGRFAVEDFQIVEGDNLFYIEQLTEGSIYGYTYGQFCGMITYGSIENNLNYSMIGSLAIEKLILQNSETSIRQLSYEILKTMSIYDLTHSIGLGEDGDENITQIIYEWGDL